MPLTPSFVKEITVDIRTLLQPTIDPNHQANANCRDQAFEDAIRCRKIPILKQIDLLVTAVLDNCSYQAQATIASLETQMFHPLGGGNLKPLVTRKA
jgi:hypothetical protein